MKIQGTNISMIRGDTEVIKATCKDRDGVDAPFETGDTIYFTLKKYSYLEEKQLQKIVTVFDEGAALIEIEPDDTKGLKEGQYYYDIQFNKADGTVKTIVPPSTFTIEGDITFE